MGKPANKHRGEVALPGFGEGCFVRFTVDAMERLASKYEDDWVTHIIDRTGKSDIGVFKTAIEVSAINPPMKKDDDGKDAVDFSGLEGNIMAVRDALIDAIFLAVHGRTFEEQREISEKEQAEEIQKRMKQFEENPQLAAAFFSQFERRGTAQDSDLTKSAA